ncbi:MAG: hypothetical protein EOR27_24065 [Mesorhizobium sp.]|nr:MAG: hypothetical protein EOR27_24065 [Mesorhizobium sp.]
MSQGLLIASRQRHLRTVSPSRATPRRLARRIEAGVVGDEIEPAIERDACRNAREHFAEWYSKGAKPILTVLLSDLYQRRQRQWILPGIKPNRFSDEADDSYSSAI